MKSLAIILLASFVGFLLTAVVEEHEAFVPLLGLAPDAAAVPAMPEEDRAAVEDAVRGFLSLLVHLYRNGGDPRFAERIHASESVVQEILDDIAYLQHNQRRQDLQLMHLEVLEAESLREDRATLLAKEYWVVRTFWSHHQGSSDAVRSVVARVRYYLEREGRTWSVNAWEYDAPPDVNGGTS